MQKLLCCFGFLVSAVWCSAQDHQVQVGNNFFNPEILTVQVGETVEWFNSGGFHNVNGDLVGNPESFGNGNPSSDPWTYEFTFTEPGVYNYQCDPHAGVGMVGTITVELPDQSADDPIVITEIMYNSPASFDLEFIELYNNGDETIDLGGWSFGAGIEHQFGDINIQPGEFVVITNDIGRFQNTFPGVPGMEWNDGSLSNGGETIQLLNSDGATVDEVSYNDEGEWTRLPDGGGPSLQLCDVNADNNDPNNWQRASTPIAFGFVEDCREMFANPNALPACISDAIISWRDVCEEVGEDAGPINLVALSDNMGSSDVIISVTVDPNSTATLGEDYMLGFSDQLSFPADTQSSQLYSLIILDDEVQDEDIETIILTLTTMADGVRLVAETITIEIFDNDIILSNALVLTAIYDGPLTGGVPKGIELYARMDIDNLSEFGVGSANNGNGTDGVEYVFPEIAVTAGTFLYVTNDTLGFNDFFGFFNGNVFVDDAVNINGDDAIELFEFNQVIDTYGEIEVDGSGQDWEYTDSWAYRIDGTGPDGVTFVRSNWIVQAVDALDGAATNADAATPIPIGTYSLTMTSQLEAHDDTYNLPFNVSGEILNITANDFLPQGVDTLFVLDNIQEGTLIQDDNSFIFTSADDFCGSLDFSYVVCDINACDTANVFITVACPTTYTPYAIADITGLDTDGVADSLGIEVQVTGVVHGVDLRGGDGVQFTLHDGTDGIGVFNFDNASYEVTEGDQLTLRGTVNQFNGLTQINPDTIIFVSANNPLVGPVVVNVLDESTESELVTLEGVTFVDISEWTGTGSGFNVRVTNGTDTFLVRIDNDVDLYNAPAPDPNQLYSITGIGGQFDNSLPYDDGYQLLPRYAEDIDFVESTENAFRTGALRNFPNPASHTVRIEGDRIMESVELYDLNGKLQRRVNCAATQTDIDVTMLPPGMYLLRVTAERQTHLTRLIVQ